MLNDFVALILTNGRPDRVYTYETLRKSGYTGPIILVVDDLDKTKDQYIEKYGNEVIIFDKKAIAKTFDQGDNFQDMRAIIYARNSSFEIAKEAGFKYFIQLDDDYVYLTFRFDNKFNYNSSTPPIKNMDDIFESLLSFYESSRASAIAISQGGDFIGGFQSSNAESIKLTRKCMNSFICSTDRPFQFIGRVNEDVNTYTHQASKGLLFLTTNQISLGQKQTQSNSGGMTEMYLDSGTYVKSFYTVMYQPSSVSIKLLQCRHPRLHHNVNWKNTVPKILSEALKKK